MQKGGEFQPLTLPVSALVTDKFFNNIHESISLTSQIIPH